jgi:hypothetical protein
MEVEIMEQCCVGCPYRAQCEAGELVLACAAVDYDPEEE